MELGGVEGSLGEEGEDPELDEFINPWQPSINNNPKQTKILNATTTGKLLSETNERITWISRPRTQVGHTWMFVI